MEDLLSVLPSALHGEAAWQSKDCPKFSNLVMKKRLEVEEG